MVAVKKIDSNVSGLRIAEELGTSGIGTLSGSEVWTPYEPNTYPDFGAEVSVVARTPISADRQRKKGVKTDIDVTAGFNSDLTQTNLADLLQGYFFADFRRKGEETPTNVDGTNEEFDVASTTGFFAGSLVWASGFDDAQNNGLHVVTTVTPNTSIAVAGSNLVDDASPSGTLVVVGHQFGAGDLDVTIPGGGNFPTYTTTTKDLTELGLIPGEWIFVGGDTAALAFTNVDGSGNEVNNGFKRVRAIAANTLTIDKSDFALTAEASATETVQVFFGRVLKNETGTLIKRRTYQAERQLGAPDDAAPTQIQAQYETGLVANEATFNIPTANKITVDLGFIGIGEDLIDGPTALKAGTRPALVETDAFNTSTDVKRQALTTLADGDEDPTPLFVVLEELTLTINNQAQALKGVGITGGFEITVGDFEVGGDLTAYFADTAAIAAVNAVNDVSLDFHLVKSNAGISFDLPLVALGDGRLNIERNEAIKIPLSNEAASGAKVNTNLNHTLLISFYDYLPTKADS